MTRPAPHRKQAKQTALELLGEFGSTIPVDVETIARAKGIDVRLEGLEDEISGMLIMRGGQVIIGVNAHHHPNRRRFTIAHELGHFLLHREDARFFIDAAPVFFRSDAATKATRDQEIAANTFAAELLMPEATLRAVMHEDLIDVFDDIAIRRLADRFGVSTQALLIRLSQLDLIVPPGR